MALFNKSRYFTLYVTHVKPSVLLTALKHCEKRFLMDWTILVKLYSPSLTENQKNFLEINDLAFLNGSCTSLLYFLPYWWIAMNVTPSWAFKRGGQSFKALRWLWNECKYSDMVYRTLVCHNFTLFNTQ